MFRCLLLVCVLVRVFTDAVSEWILTCFTAKLPGVPSFMVVVPLRRRKNHARCSRDAPPRRRLARRLVFLPARAAQPSEHEDMWVSVDFTFSQLPHILHDSQRDSRVDFHDHESLVPLRVSTISPVRVQFVTSTDLAVTQHFKGTCACH